MATVAPRTQPDVAKALAIALAVVSTAVILAIGVEAMTHQSVGAPAAGASPVAGAGGGVATTAAFAIIALPSPDTSDGLPLNEALQARRSVRDFTSEALTDRELGQLLWAAQGITNADGRRTAPSAGALYPLEVYAVSASGVARYLPAEHALQVRTAADRRGDLAAAALGQTAVREAPAILVITGVTGRTAQRYGDRAGRYVALEAGHAAQNVLLEAVSLGLAAVPVGAFEDQAVASVLGLAGDEQPLYLIPVGHAR